MSALRHSKIMADTLTALMKDWPYRGRSLDRLWIDGGSSFGFHACRIFGFAEYVRRSDGSIAKIDHETLVRPTQAGVEFFNKYWRKENANIDTPDQHDRSRLVNALSARYDDTDQWRDLVARSSALCWQVYALVYDEDTAARIKRLPSGWLPAHDYVTAHFGDNTTDVKLHFNGLSRFLPRISEKEITDAFPPTRAPYLAQDYFNMQAVKIKESSKLFKLFNTLSAEGVKLEEERKKVVTEIKQVVYSSSTTKALTERWPEVGPVVAQIVMPYVTAENLPAPIMKGLNKKLKLEKAA